MAVGDDGERAEKSKKAAWKSRERNPTATYEGSCPTDGKRGERGQRVYSGNKAEHRFGNEKGGQEC